MPQVGPCSPWVTQAEIEAVGSTPDDIDADLWEQLAGAATAVLFHLSGRQYAGECTRTVRPTCATHGDTGRGHAVRNLNEGCCEQVRSVRLGVYPVTSITNVTVDGVILDPGAYRIDGDRELVRIDGRSWPCCQDLNLEAGESGTWTVDVAFGTVPDPAGLFACAELARQYGLAFTQNDKCKLPQRVQSIVRQGVSMTVLDPQDFLDHGRTGIYLIDLWLKAVNPSGERRRARVFSPDFGPDARAVTG